MFVAVIKKAARVAAFRKRIDAATAGSGIDPNVLEGIVFLESAGRPNVIAGTDPAAASGLTQILAQTGQSLLGMRINLARSRRLTAQMVRAANAGRGVMLARLERQRARIDDRFDPTKARNELGLPTTPLRTTIQRAVDWFRTHAIP